MSEEKDRHLDVEKLFDAKTNTFFNSKIDIINADLTKNVFSSENQTKSNVIIPRSQTHDVEDNHLTDDQVQQLSDMFSAGLLTGGVISDGGSETIDVSAGTGMIRIEDDQTAELITISWDAESSLAIPTDTSRHVGIEYNDGSPRVLLTDTDSDFNEHNNFHLGDVVNEGTVLHIQNLPHEVADAINHMIERMVQTVDPARGSGLILSESGDANRRVTVTAGTIWNRLTESSISAIDTDPGGVADTFDIYYRADPSGFTKVANQSAWDMDSYDDGSGTLQTLTSANKRAVIWFYMEFDGALVAQYGRAEYNTLAQAENEGVPNTAPDRISEHAILIGRIIFQKDTTPAEQVDTVFTTFMTSTGVTDHDGLGNIQTDDHHAATVSGDIDHDATANFEADEHLTTGAINHNVLANLNAGDFFEHITQDQKDALHDIFTAEQAIAAVENETTLDLLGDLTVVAGKTFGVGAINAAYKIYIEHTTTDLGVRFSNVSNSANVDTIFDLLVGGTSAGDPYLRFVVPGGSTWSVGVDNSDGDAFIISRAASLATVQKIKIDATGNVTIFAGNLIMQGSGSDDKALQLPYLTEAPATLVNGKMWMESDGLHIYYNGAEKIVAGV